MVALRVIPLYAAEITEVVVEVTALVATEEVAAEVPPAGTVTVAGTVTTAVLLLVSDTTAPPVGAGAVSVTVAEAVAPPTTVAGLTVTELRAGAVTVHPDSRTLTAATEPSFTSTVQSAGLVKPERSILNDPSLLLVAICMPSTVIGRLAVALPSIRSLSPLTSARETVTAAWAIPAKATERTAVRNPSANAIRLRRPVMSTSWLSHERDYRAVATVWGPAR
jgi:hypothetical protein